MDAVVEFLKSVPYYSGLSQAELESVRKHVFETTANRDEMVLVEGETTGALYLLASGVVKLLKTSAEGKEQILSIVRTGDAINDVPVFDGGVNPFSARAMTSVTLYGIDKEDIDTIFREHPRTVQNAVRVMAQRVRSLMELVEDLSFRPVISRLARILLEQSSDGPASHPRLTQQEMAAMAGTAREMIGRSLKLLEENHAIRLDRHRIIITDKKALRDMAGVSR